MAAIAMGEKSREKRDIALVWIESSSGAKMKPTGPLIVFFKTFFVLLMVMCGLIGIMALLWFIHHICRRRSNANAQESLPMPEMNTVKPIEATKAEEHEAVPEVVIIDTSEGGNPARETTCTIPTNPKGKRRKLRPHKADPRGGIWMKAEFDSQGETSSTQTECDMSQAFDLPVVDEADELDPPAVEGHNPYMGMGQTFSVGVHPRS